MFTTGVQITFRAAARGVGHWPSLTIGPACLIACVGIHRLDSALGPTSFGRPAEEPRVDHVYLEQKTGH